MNIAFEPLHWLVFNPHGLVVQGLHKDQTLPVHEDLENAFDDLWPKLNAHVLSTPGGFNGDCAPLIAWAHGDEEEEEKRQTPLSQKSQLIVATGYRPYVDSHTLKRLVHDANLDHGELSNDVQPDPFLSWGTTLATVVLLPNSTVLVGKRSQNVQTNPNQWSCIFTEIVEPRDITWDPMDPLLDRVMAEELPSFVGIAQPKFVGLVHVLHTYAWMLIAVVDARDATQSAVQKALDGLVPDNETSAWAQVSLVHAPHNTIGFVLAQQLAEKMATSSRHAR